MNQQLYLGNYLGLVVNSSDPEYRGRVQVFVPHIMPALYESWNEQGADIDITCVGSNIPQGMTPELHSRLIKILPWAEAASPIIGGSSPGNLFTDFYTGVKNAVGSAATAVSNFFNQGPTSQPIPVEGGDASALIDKAKQISGLSFDGSKWGKCARGTTALDKAAGLIDNNGASAGFFAASDLAAGGTNETGYNPYTTGTGAKYFQPAFTVDPATYKPQVGDSVYAGGGGGEGHGHAQKCIGFDSQGKAIWASDNVQSKFFTSNKTASYNNFTVYRLNDEGLKKYSAAIGGKLTGQEPPSTTNTEQAADSRPASDNNLARADGSDEPSPNPETAMVDGGPATGTPAGTISGGGTATTLTADEKGRVDPAQLQSYVKQRLETTNSSLLGKKFPEYGISNGTSDEWGNFFTKLAEKESGYNIKPRSEAGESDPGGSYGLFQVSPLNGTRYKANPAGKNWTIEELRDPANNTNTAIRIFEQNLSTQSTMIQTRGGVTAGVGYFSLTSMNKIKMDIGDGKPVNFAQPVTGATSVVNNTDDNGRTPILNTNDMPNGMFAYPNPGAMVWVFFREGNPLYPVYFAASYSATEWKNAYRGGSEGDLMAHGESDPTTKTTSSVMKFHPAATILAKEKVSLTNPQDNEAVFSLVHEHGSNLTFKNGCDFYFSRNNKRDEVDNDRFIITKGYKEQWTQGDESSNIKGNQIIKVGNISQEAIDAMNELANMSYEMNQVLMNK